MNKRKLLITKKALETSQSHTAEVYSLSRQRIAQICEEMFQYLAEKNKPNFGLSEYPNFRFIQSRKDHYLPYILAEIKEIDSES